jgi:ATP-dependent helicase/nuclease subunit B
MTVSDPGFSSKTIEHESLFERLRAGNTLVTGNSRLSKVITGRYNDWRIGQGDQQWPSPDIVSWSVWLDRLWEMASLQAVNGTDRAVPGSRQLSSLWEHILKNEPRDHQLLRPESLATQLQETRRLMKAWQLNFKDPSWFDTENENFSAFYHWNKAFEKRCTEENWFSPEDRISLLLTAIDKEEYSISGSFDLLGFDDFDPAQLKLLEALEKAGSPICRWSFTSQRDQIVMWKGKDSKNELENMARWARYWLEEQPQSSIAIVVHDLQTRRQEVERQLAEILLPGISQNGQSARPWNISLGTPLSRVPMVETAFDLLKLLDRRIDIQDVGRVLRSAWLTGALAERNNRALLEKCLRDKYPRQLKLSEVRYRASEIKTHDRHHVELPEDQHEPQPWNSPELAAVLNKLSHFSRENTNKRPPSAWAESFDKLLQSLGWPLADEPPEDHDHNWQALQVWRDALRELASLDATIAGLDRNSAIHQLKQICRETIFQARSATASIQVLGLYEVSGLRFDHLWVLGLHNDNWPASAKPNPFIPRSLQREAQIPNSSPQRELEVAQTITKRLLETAADCVFSYPGQIDGEDVMPSPLLADAMNVSDKDLSGWRGDSWKTTVTKADGPLLDPLLMPGKLIHGTARGGSTILKHQALCPFRAFASNRLGADGLETPADGISPMLHGSLIHSVLEHFWKETKTQAALLSLDGEALDARVLKHVDRVTKEDRGLNQRKSFMAVEAARLHRHVIAFLQQDMQRDSFEVVGFEQEILPKIEGQSVRLIIDRIDQTPDGDEIIIDYKTGKVEPKKWFGDRPEDPQLPLYAISAKTTPAALAFGVVRDDGCLYKGVVKQEGLLPDLPPKRRHGNEDLIDAGLDLEASIENWRVVIHRLMANFLAGEAMIDPKAGLKTCDNSYCELQSLCRVNELDKRNKAALNHTDKGSAS